MKKYCDWWLLPLLACLLTGCGDDDYHYPSVKLEFLTAFSGADGYLQLFLSVNNFFKFIFSDFSINCSNFQNIYVPWTRQNVTIAFSFRQVLFLYFYFLFYKKSQRKSSIRR